MELLVRRAVTASGAARALQVQQQNPAATFQVAFYRSKKSRSKDEARRGGAAESDKQRSRDAPRKPQQQQQRYRKQQRQHEASFFAEQEEVAAPEPPRDLEKEWDAMRARTLIVPPPILPAATKREIQNKLRMRRLGLLNDDDESNGGSDSSFDYESVQRQRRSDAGRFSQQEEPPLHLRKNERSSDAQPGRRAVSKKLKQFTNMESAPDSVVEREFLIPDEPEHPKALDIAVIGRPNAGKSSIMNRLLNVTVSAVSAKYNTTRDRVLGILTEKDRQLTFYDTPGIIKPKYVCVLVARASLAF